MEIKNFEINKDKSRPHLASFSVKVMPFATINKFFVLQNKKNKKYFWLAPCYRKSPEDKTNYPIVDFGDRFDDFRNEVHHLLEPFLKQLDQEGR